MAEDPDSRSTPKRRPGRGRLRGAGARLVVEVVGARTSTERRAAAGLGRWLAGLVPAEVAGAVTVALVSDARIRWLNRRFRGDDRVTDVLSFAAGTGPGVGADLPPLGDIVIARGRAQRQARVAAHNLQAELRTLALHGMLHLLGYDHAHDRGEMARLERRLRRRGGLPEGVIERASAASSVAGRKEAP